MRLHGLLQRRYWNVELDNIWPCNYAKVSCSLSSEASFGANRRMVSPQLSPFWNAFWRRKIRTRIWKMDRNFRWSWVETLMEERYGVNRRKVTIGFGKWWTVRNDWIYSTHWELAGEMWVGVRLLTALSVRVERLSCGRQCRAIWEEWYKQSDVKGSLTWDNEKDGLERGVKGDAFVIWVWIWMRTVGGIGSGWQG